MLARFRQSSCREKGSTAAADRQVFIRRGRCYSCFNLVAELWLLLLLLLSVVALVTLVVVYAATSVETAIKDAVNNGRNEMCDENSILVPQDHFQHYSGNLNNRQFWGG